MPSAPPSRIALALVGLAWLAFWSAIAWRTLNRRPSEPVARRATGSRVGVLLQAAGFALLFSLAAGPPLARVAWRPPWDAIAGGAASFLAVASAFLAVSAVRVLGKQWSIQARVLKDHELVTWGPYDVVRHPVYAALAGLLVASGLAFGQTWETLVALALFLAGTGVRIRAEERLLAGVFGAEFEAYRRRVPALVPFVKRPR